MFARTQNIIYLKLLDPGLDKIRRLLDNGAYVHITMRPNKWQHRYLVPFVRQGFYVNTRPDFLFVFYSIPLCCLLYFTCEILDEHHSRTFEHGQYASRCEIIRYKTHADRTLVNNNNNRYHDNRYTIYTVPYIVYSNTINRTQLKSYLCAVYDFDGSNTMPSSS